ncbi:MAG: DNA replication/repair protein RecF [Alphaproteobacteria bacterium]|nr:MAG: DNA replication/repair protein RecF [Alphaproteobacteria bacterium]
MTRHAVETLRLVQFRSHARCAIDCGGRSVLVVGANGAGKTNLLEAVSMLSPGRGLRGAPPEALARQPGPGGWKVEAEISGPAGRHAVASWARPGQGRQVAVDGKAVAQLALAERLTVLWLTPAMDRLWAEGAADRRRFLDRVAMSFHPAHAAATIRYEKAMRERNRLLREDVRDAAWYLALEAQMADAAGTITANRRDAIARLMAAQADAATAFPRAELELLAPEQSGAAGGDLAALLAEGRARDRAAGRTLAGPHRADLRAVFAEKGTEAQLCSTGEQKALLISLILANARALAAMPGGAVPVLLLDEVAAHLDRERRAALHEEVAALGAQAWMTGTDAALFADFIAPALRLRAEEGPQGSRLAPAEGCGAAVTR